MGSTNESGQVFRGFLNGEGRRFGVVVSRFNEFISNRLLSGAKDCLVRHGVRETDIDVAWVPGSFELPLVAQRLVTSKRYDAVICLGALIRGATPHFEYIAAEVTKGIAQVQLATGAPVTFGVLTTDTIEQAIERAGAKAGNKGWDAALSALEMVDLMKKLDATASE